MHPTQRVTRLKRQLAERSAQCHTWNCLIMSSKSVCPHSNLSYYVFGIYVCQGGKGCDHDSDCCWAALYPVTCLVCSTAQRVGRSTSGTNTGSSSSSQSSTAAAPTTAGASATTASAAPVSATAAGPRMSRSQPLSADAPAFVPRAPGANNNGGQFIVWRVHFCEGGLILLKLSGL